MKGVWWIRRVVIGTGCRWKGKRSSRGQGIKGKDLRSPSVRSLPRFLLFVVNETFRRLQDFSSSVVSTFNTDRLVVAKRSRAPDRRARRVSRFDYRFRDEVEDYVHRDRPSRVVQGSAEDEDRGVARGGRRRATGIGGGVNWFSKGVGVVEERSGSALCCPKEFEAVDEFLLYLCFLYLS